MLNRRPELKWSKLATGPDSTSAGNPPAANDSKNTNLERDTADVLLIIGRRDAAPAAAAPAVGGYSTCEPTDWRAPFDPVLRSGLRGI